MPGQRKSQRDLEKSMRGLLDQGLLRTPAGPGRSMVEDGGSDLAVARAEAAVAAGRPLRPTERREIRHDVFGRQAPAGQQPAAKPTLRQRLEAKSPAERRAVLAGIKGEREHAHIARTIASIENVEADADFLHAQWLEEQALANDEDAMPQRYWPEEPEPLTEDELQAHADIAAATAGPLYTGDPEELYSDDLDDGYADDDLGGEAA